MASYVVDSRLPEEVLTVESLQEVQEALTAARSGDHAVIPSGGLTMLGLGMPPARYDVALDMSAMNSIVEYEPDDFTITVQAGLSLADLQRELASNGQFLPLDHPQFERATVGGICAVGRGGLRRNAFGGPRDWLIGMRMVKADGTTVKGGGKVVKNVSGYDLPKLFAGSLGTLGVIAEVTFKLRPQPASDQVVSLGAATLAQALSAARGAAKAAPFLNGCVVLSAEASARATAMGAEIPGDGPTIVLRASGLESAAGEVLAAAIAAAREAGIEGPETRTTAIVETWQAITDLELSTPRSHVRLRVGLPPGNLERAQSLIEERTEGATCWVVAADSGLLFAECPHIDGSAVDSLRNALGPLQGRLTIESAPLELKRSCDVWGPAGPGIRLMRNIKEQFDPQGILSPGRFVGGI